VTVDTLIADMDKALSSRHRNAWTMPIKARIDMLSTGIRTPIGVKVYGPDLAGIDRCRARSKPIYAGCPAPAAPTRAGADGLLPSKSRPTALRSPATV